MRHDACFERKVLEFVSSLTDEHTESPNALYYKLASAGYIAAAIAVLYMDAEAFDNYITYINFSDRLVAYS